MDNKLSEMEIKARIFDVLKEMDGFHNKLQQLELKKNELLKTLEAMQQK
jgi:hypothetical protein